MKKITMTIFLICMLSLPFVSSSFAQKNGNGNGKGGGNQGQTGTCEMVAALPLEDLSDAEEHYITLMREEEKLARDVYLTLSEDWDLNIFANIAASEQRHMDAVGTLIAKYGLSDPAVDDTIGAYSDPLGVGLAELYEKLVLQGQGSVVDALLVGAFIEDLDIYDLLEALKAVNNADIQMVFENLLQGSANHYAAFTRLLAGWGESYEPEYFDVEELAAVLSTLPEKRRGGKGSKSMSRRGGQGRGTAQGPQDGSGPGNGSCPFDN